MIAGTMGIVFVLGGAMLLCYALPHSAMDRLVHIFRFDEDDRP